MGHDDEVLEFHNKINFFFYVWADHNSLFSGGEKLNQMQKFALEFDIPTYQVDSKKKNYNSRTTTVYFIWAQG